MRKTLKEVLRQFTPLPNPFEPLFNCRGKQVQISTWGLTFGIDEIVERVTQAKKVQLLIGYSKATHNLSDLLAAGIVLEKRYGWEVRYLPGFHVKIWIVGGDAYVGSANLSANTIVNRMWKVPRSEVLAYFRSYWIQGYEITPTTDLKLIPAPKIHPRF